MVGIIGKNCVVRGGCFSASRREPPHKQVVARRKSLFSCTSQQWLLNDEQEEKCMNTPLVKKIGKPVLIVGIAVAMACLLFPFGDTTHQAHAAAKDTSADLIEVLSPIATQRTQLAQSLSTLNTYGAGYDYYTQAASDYDTYIVDQVNQWLSNLTIEAQNNMPLNSGMYNDGSTDKSIITKAMTESYRLNAWASSVASGSGVPLEDFDFNISDDSVQGFLQAVNRILNTYNSHCDQNLNSIEAWYPSGIALQNPISGQLVPRPYPECNFYP